MPADHRPADGTVSIHRPIVWITGASRGVGREIAKQFAWTGYEVCASARSRRDLASLAAEIRTEEGRIHLFPLDLRKLDTIAGVARAIDRTVGPVDLLVNNAGITVFKTIADTTLREFESIITTNLLAQIACAKAVLPAMIRRKSGMIINIISHAAVKSFEESGAYTASKAGMYGFGRVLREEVKGYGIKVVNMLPGPIATEMWSAADRRKFARRMMSPKSVAETVLALYQLPNDVVADDVILRPVLGDIP